MTKSPKSGNPAGVPQRKRWNVRILLPLTSAILERIDAVLKRGPDGKPIEARLDAIREWIERGIKSREKHK